MLAALSLMTSTGAFALAAGNERIENCLNDYFGVGLQPHEVIQKYCVCVDRKMGPSETMTILAWELSHGDDEAACRKDAGWNDN